MSMTRQPPGVTRHGIGSERPHRAFVTRHNNKIIGLTIRLGEKDKTEKWLAVSPDWAPVGETRTHNEALFLLAPDVQAPARKTSVRLDGGLDARVRRSGLSLPDLIRKGLDSLEP